MTMPKPDDPGTSRDPRLDAAWHAASPEEPPAVLDAAIRAAARREVGAGPQSLGAQAAMRARRRWWPLAAAATIAAVAVGVVQRIAHEDIGVPTGNVVVSDVPTQAAKPATEPVRSSVEAVTPAPHEEAAASGGGAAEGRQRADEMAQKQAAGIALPAPSADAVRRSAPVATAPAPKKQETPPAAATALPEPFPAASPKLGAAMPPDAIPASPPSAAGGVAVSAPAPRPSPMAKSAASLAETQRKDPEARIKDRAPLPVPDWVALIRRLRAEGNIDDAARELAAFRAAHTDHEKLLPPDLRDWRPVEK